MPVFGPGSLTCNPEYILGLTCGSPNTILTELFVSASWATKECAAGASAATRQDQVTHSKKNEVKQQADVRHAEVPIH